MFEQAFFYVLGLVMGGVFMWLADHSHTDEDGEWEFYDERKGGRHE